MPAISLFHEVKLGSIYFWHCSVPFPCFRIQCVEARKKCRQSGDQLYQLFRGWMSIGVRTKMSPHFQLEESYSMLEGRGNRACIEIPLLFSKNLAVDPFMAEVRVLYVWGIMGHTSSYPIDGVP